jgi:hypothetical protein
MYREVYEALDASVAALTCLPSSEATVRRAIFLIERESGDRWAVDHLGKASLALQALSVSARSGERSQRIAATRQLGSVARTWMERLPIH